MEKAASENDREDIWDSLIRAKKAEIEGKWYSNTLTSAEVKADGTGIGVAEFTGAGVKITGNGAQLGVVSESIDVDITYNYLTKVLGKGKEWDLDDGNVLLPFDGPAQALLNVTGTVTDPQKVAKVSFGSDGFFKANGEGVAVDALELVCTGAENNAGGNIDGAERLTTKDLGTLTVDGTGMITFAPNWELTQGTYDVTLTATDGDGSTANHDFSFNINY